MTGFDKSHRSPARLSAFARAAFQAHLDGYAVAGMFPVVASPTLDWNTNIADNVLPRSARFRAVGSESEVGVLTDTASFGGKLPPISIRTPVDEYQQLFMYNQQDAIGAAFERRAGLNAASIASRLVLAQLDALTTGKVKVDERGQSYEIDFRRKAGLTATASTVWTNPAADPIADLEALRLVLGAAPVRTAVSDAVAFALQGNTAIIKAVTGRGTDLPSRVTWEAVRSVIAEYRLGSLEVWDEKIVDTTGAQRGVLGDYVLISTQDTAGVTQVGVPAESINPDNGIGGAEQAGLFAGAIHSHDPEGFNVLVSAIALPVVGDANTTASLKVR